MVKEEHHSSLLKSLEKSLDVLDLFVECNTGMTLKEIAEHTHLNTSTAFRIVNTLERRQYLTRNDTSKQYRLGPRALALGYSSHWTENVITLAKPYLRRLQQLFNETVSIYIAEGDCRICLDHVESTHSLRRVIPIGESLPLYKGAAGRVLLAWTSDDERQRYTAIFLKKSLLRSVITAMPLPRMKASMDCSPCLCLSSILKARSSPR